MGTQTSAWVADALGLCVCYSTLLVPFIELVDEVLLHHAHLADPAGQSLRVSKGHDLLTLTNLSSIEVPSFR